MTYTSYFAQIYSEHWRPNIEIYPIHTGGFDTKADADYFIRDILTKCPYLIAFIEEVTNVNGQIYIKKERWTV